MARKLVGTFFLSVVLLSISALAQSNELGVTVGGYFPVNSAASSGNAFAVGGSFAHRVFGVPFVSLYFELPVYGTFNSTSDIVSTTQGNAKYSALFITPGLKLKFGSVFPISPYLVAGGGLARFSKSNVSTEDTTNTGTFDVGGGLDFKIAPFVSARAEVRDFYSGNPKILNNFTEREHQLITSVGLVLRF
jgi:opacity protein-like surface antigen